MFTRLAHDIIGVQYPYKLVDEPLPSEYIDTVVPAFVRGDEKPIE
jgi:hypothetical protein